MNTALEFELISEHMSDGLYMTDTDRRIVYWNAAAERITGFRREEVVGRRCADNILCHVDGQGRLLCRQDCPLQATMLDGRPREAHVFLHHKHGHRVPITVTTCAQRAEDGRITGGIELFTDPGRNRDASARMAELESLAMLDPLTGLPNRRHLDAQLASRLHLFHDAGVSLGVLFIDIDHFRAFNTRYGHPVGDRVLCTVAKTLSCCCREDDVIGRWGGEEFVGLYRGVDAPSLGRLARRLCRLVRATGVPWGDRELTVTVSVGATLARPGDTAESLAARADALMYRSKAAGRDCCMVEEDTPDPSS